MDIDCKCGKSFSSRVLGGRTSCPKCKKSYYIRKDGTTGPRTSDDTPPTPPTTAGTRRPTRKVTKVAYARPNSEPPEPDADPPTVPGEPDDRPAKRAASRVQRPQPRVRKRTGRTAAAPDVPPPIQPVVAGSGKRQGKPRRSGPYDALFGW